MSFKLVCLTFDVRTLSYFYFHHQFCVNKNEIRILYIKLNLCKNIIFTLYTAI